MKQSENTLGVRVRRAREAAGLSQADLAKKLGYKTPSTIARIESGENDLTQSKLAAFAAALDVPVGYLLGDALGIPVTLSADTERRVDNVQLAAILIRLKENIDAAFNAAISEALQGESRNAKGA